MLDAEAVPRQREHAPLLLPAGLTRVQTVARVRRLLLARLRVHELVAPALRADGARVRLLAAIGDIEELARLCQLARGRLAAHALQSDLGVHALLSSLCRQSHVRHSLARGGLRLRLLLCGERAELGLRLVEHDVAPEGATVVKEVRQVLEERRRRRLRGVLDSKSREALCHLASRLCMQNRPAAAGAPPDRVVVNRVGRITASRAGAVLAEDPVERAADSGHCGYFSVVALD